MRIIIAEKGKPINLGRVGEDITKVVKFDLSEIAFPNATYTIAHKPQGATASYFGDSYVENGMLCWLIHDSDLVKTGIGRCEVIATGNGVAKSYIYQTRVDESIDGEIGEVPPPYQPWVDSVLKEFAFSHKLENITCHYVSIPHSAEPHCDSEETEDGLILTFYIPMGADGRDGKDGKDAKEPFIAIYGETSFQDIKDAYDDGRVCYASRVVESNVFIYEVAHMDTTAVDFGCVYLTYLRTVRVSKPNHWTNSFFSIASSIGSGEEQRTDIVPTAKATTDYVDSALTHKMEKHILDYDGQHISENGNVLSFGTIYGWLLDAPDFVVLVYDNYAYHPNGVSTEQIVFSCSYPVNGMDTSHRITMLKNGTVTKVDATSENVVNKADAITELNKDSSTKYPSTKAVADFYLGTNNVASLTEAEKKSARARIGASGYDEVIAYINETYPILDEVEL